MTRKKTTKRIPKNLKLNLGGGAHTIPGFTNIDLCNGQPAYPLPYPDESVDEIRASHILEHFPHEQTVDVLKDWYRVLKRGGKMRIAVPDFDVATKVYQSAVRDKYPIEGWVCGSHVDENDVHGAIFDKAKLKSQLQQIGLLRIEHWTSEIPDCASFDVSLNLGGIKPTVEQEKNYKIQAVMSVPRLGFMDNFFCVTQLVSVGIPVRKFTGAFWGACLERAMQMAIDDDVEIIVTLDYDTVFTLENLADLMYAVKSYPEYDAFAPMQVSRGDDQLLMCNLDKEGNAIPETIAQPYYDTDAVPADSAHFGMTAIRVSALKKMNHPWFLGVPAPDGTWGDGRIDDDIFFWRQFKRAGNQLAMCPRVAIGHMELMVRWPGRNMQAHNQTITDYHEKGAPPEVWQ